MLIVAMIPVGAAAADVYPATFTVNSVEAKGTNPNFTAEVSSSDVKNVVISAKDEANQATFVVVKSGKTPVDVTAPGKGVDLTEYAEQEGSVYTLTIRAQKAQEGDSAPVILATYKLAITASASAKSSDTTLHHVEDDAMVSFEIGTDTVTITYPFNYDYASADSTFVATSDKAEVTVNGDVVRVTAENGSWREYKVTRTNRAGIVSFTIPDQIGSSVITQNKDADYQFVEIDITVPYGYNFNSKIVPTFELGPDVAHLVSCESNTLNLEDVVMTSSSTKVTLVEGWNDQIFLCYVPADSHVVHGNHGDLPVFVKITVADNTAASITSITVDNGDGKKSEPTKVEGKEISVEMPKGTVLTKTDGVVTVAAPAGATVTIPEQGLTADENGKITGVDLSGGTFYVRVVSQDKKTTTEYHVTLKNAALVNTQITSITATNFVETRVATVSGSNFTITLPYMAKIEGANWLVTFVKSTGTTVYVNGVAVENGISVAELIASKNPVELRVEGSDGEQVRTYTLTVKYDAAKTAHLLTAAELTSESQISKITADNTYDVRITTAKLNGTTNVNVLKVSVPYSLKGDLTSTGIDAWFTKLTASTGAKVFTPYGEIIALDSGIYAEEDGLDKFQSILFNDGGYVSSTNSFTNGYELYVVDEKSYVDAKGNMSGFFTEANEKAGKFTKYYVFGVAAEPATGYTLTKVASTDDTNVSASLSGKTVTVTVPYSYNQKGTEFALEITKAYLATVKGGVKTAKSAEEYDSVYTVALASNEKKFVVEDGKLSFDGNEITYIGVINEKRNQVENYTVKVVVNKAESGADLTNVKYANGTYSVSDRSATLTVPYGTQLNPADGVTFVASKLATVKVQQNGKVVEEGLAPLTVSGLDLNHDVTVTVTSEDGKSAKVYTLKTVVGKLFPDAIGHWGYDNIVKAAGMGIVSGYTDGTFKPNGAVTRAEFASMIVKLLENGSENWKADYTAPTFSDVAADNWAAPAIAYVQANGIMNGYGDGTFKPNASISRQEAAATLVNALKLTGTSSETFTDDAKIASWAKSHVYACKAAGVMNGDTSGAFRPTATLTRAEAASIVVNAAK